MGDYRITVTMAGPGMGTEDCAERVLDAFESTHPEVGPVVEVDIESATLAVTFSLEGPDVEEALNLGRPVWVEGMVASGLDADSYELVGLNAELVVADERELQPA